MYYELTKSNQTGAASGIGLAVAKRLVADGIKQLALIDLNSDSLAEAHKSVTSVDSSVNAIPIAIDVGKEEQVEAAIASTVEKFGRIDVCLNAAGISGTFGGVVDLTIGDLDKVLDVNLKGVWFCERAQIRQMLKQELRDVRSASYYPNLLTTVADIEKHGFTVQDKRKHH